MPASPVLIAMLVCPKCKGELQYSPSPEHLTCPVCRLRYSVVDDIPVMLVHEAEKI